MSPLPVPLECPKCREAMGWKEDQQSAPLRPMYRCKDCKGKGTMARINFHRRLRTREEIARWFLKQPEWKNASRSAEGDSLVLRASNGAILKLRHVGYLAKELSP